MSTHGTPLNVNRFAHFSAAVMTALPREISAARTVAWERNRGELQEELKKTLDPPAPVFRPLLTVRLGKYNTAARYISAITKMGMRVNLEGIQVRELPVGQTEEDVDLVEVSTRTLSWGTEDEFKRTLNGHEVIELGKKLGLRPPRLEVALALRAAYGVQGRNQYLHFISEDSFVANAHYECCVGRDYREEVGLNVRIRPFNPKRGWIDSDWLFELPRRKIDS